MLSSYIMETIQFDSNILKNQNFPYYWNQTTQNQHERRFKFFFSFYINEEAWHSWFFNHALYTNVWLREMEVNNWK